MSIAFDGASSSPGAAAWPLAVQRGDRVRRIGVLVGGR